MSRVTKTERNLAALTCAEFLNSMLVSEHDDMIAFLISRPSTELARVEDAMRVLGLPGAETLRRRNGMVRS